MSEKVWFESENFKVEETTTEQGEEQVQITGVAVPYEKESRNGVIYSEDSIRKNADTLEGRPFLFNHDPDQVLGKVTNATPGENVLEFEAHLDPEKEKVRDIKNGYVQTVSIQAMVEEAEEGEDNRVHVDEFLELSSAPIPGFDDAQAQTQAVRIEEFTGVEQQQDWEVQEIAYDVAVRTNWDGVDKEEFPDEQMWRSVHLVRHGTEFHLPVAHFEDDQIKLVYEALNSAYDLIENIDGIPAETVNEARNVLQTLKEEEFPDAAPLDADAEKEEEDNDGDNDMDGETQTEAEGDVAGEDILEYAASHFDGMDVADFTAPVDDQGGDFVGSLNIPETAALLADRFDVDQGEIMDVLDQFTEDEATDDDEEPDDDGDDGMDDEEVETQEDIEEEEVEETEETEEEEESEDPSIEELLQRIQRLEDELLNAEQEGEDTEEESEEEEDGVEEEAVENSKQPETPDGSDNEITAKDLAREIRDEI